MTWLEEAFGDNDAMMSRPMTHEVSLPTALLHSS